MNADELADAPGSEGTRFGRGFHRSNIATHEDRDVAIEEIFFANQSDIGRFYIASAASTAPTKPRVSINPNASFTLAPCWLPVGSVAEAHFVLG